MDATLYESMGSLSINQSYTLTAAIDLGTTFSGYAYSFKSSPDDILMNNNWGSESGHTSYKAPTIVLTNPGGSFNSFGYEAEKRFSQIDAEEDGTRIGGPTGYNLYRQFKMVLHKKNVKLTTPVFSTTGHTRKAIDIFAMVLHYLSQHLMETINKAITCPLALSDVRWVLTVPAIWSESSKQFMREAAQRAGLIDEKYSNKLVIGLEPEVASIYCQSFKVQGYSGGNKTDPNATMTFKHGDRMLIVDCGGGTVDMTAHQVLATGNVKEIISPSGGPWGGITINHKFSQFIEKIFGEEFIKEFKTSCPEPWLQLMNAFELSKRMFRNEETSHMQVQIPLMFHLELQKAYSQHGGISEAIKAFGDSQVSFGSGYLKIKNKRAKEFFEETVSGIVGHVSELLSDSRLKDLNYILLVGGFSKCEIMQEIFQSLFSKTVKVLVPMDPDLTILKGAVMFGHNPYHIESRISLFTYGKRIAERFIEGIHDPRKKIENENGVFCRQCFYVLVHKGEEVKTGESRSFYSSPLMEGQTKAQMEFYITDRMNVQYTDEPYVQRVAVANLCSPDNALSSKIETKLTIGHTELLIEARDTRQGEFFPMQVTMDFCSD